LVIGGVLNMPITPSITPNGRGPIGGNSLVIGRTPIVLLA
jgi:hypothetical protein